jgi:hypothetical protein
MRTNVTFRHPAEFTPVSEDDGILAVAGAAWFVDMLRRIPGLDVNSPLVQEDWGVVATATRSGCRFWVGLSLWPEGEAAWLAHVHHGSSAWIQRFTTKGKDELQRLARDLHTTLQSDSAVRDVVWYREADMVKPAPDGASHPDAA